MMATAHQVGGDHAFHALIERRAAEILREVKAQRMRASREIGQRHRRFMERLRRELGLPA